MLPVIGAAAGVAALAALVAGVTLIRRRSKRPMDTESETTAPGGSTEMTNADAVELGAKDLNDYNSNKKNPADTPSDVSCI